MGRGHAPGCIYLAGHAASCAGARLVPGGCPSAHAASPHPAAAALPTPALQASEDTCAAAGNCTWQDGECQSNVLLAMTPEQLVDFGNAFTDFNLSVWGACPNTQASGAGPAAVPLAR